MRTGVYFQCAVRSNFGVLFPCWKILRLYEKRDNRTEDAAVMLERCIRLDSGYTPAYLLLARLYAGAGLQTRVGELLRQLVRLQPSSADRLADYGDWLLQQGRRLEALELYQRALAESCTHRAALLGAARILRSQGQLGRVHQLLLRSLAMSPHYRGGVVYTGDLLLRSWHLNAAYQQEKVPVYSRNEDVPERSQATVPVKQSTTVRPKTIRRGSDKWKRRCANHTKAAVTSRGESPRQEADSASRPLWLHHVGQNSGTAVFQQGFDFSYWSDRQLPPLSLPTEEDFSTELTTG